MIKIEYPYNEKSFSITKEEFEREYVDLIISTIDTIETNKILNAVTFKSSKEVKGEKLTIEKLLVLGFEDLLSVDSIIENKILNLSKDILKNNHPSKAKVIDEYFSTRKTNVDYNFKKKDASIRAKILDDLNILKKNRPSQKTIYKTLQKKISNFFMKYSVLLNKKTCYYCNIEYINTISQRGKNLNHFTLDHFLSQTDFPYYSLCLYNFVPSCYSCNSKFKRTKKFVFDENLKFLSPTSNEYTIFTDCEFKLLFNIDGINEEDKIQNIRKIEDFEVVLQNRGTTPGYNSFLDMFKLEGRYNFHKNEAFKMILKRQIYSDSDILEIEKTLGYIRDFDSIKKDIFGSAIFNEEEKNNPLTRYRTEIAKQLGLL